jgi:predicted outer membrane repeat protein
VDQASGNDGYEGRSWSTPKATVQAGLTAAVYFGGCEIWVAQGTYTPTMGSDPNATFQLEEGVDLYGGFVGGESYRDERNWETNTTILSGDLGTENTYHVVTGADDSMIDGFTIADGDATDYDTNDNGGGMLNEGVSPTVVNCTFTNNSAWEWGGGMYNANASPIVTNCVFLNNEGSGYIGSGGGICNVDSTTVITDCLFQDNLADGLGTSEYPGRGGGMYNLGSAVTVTGCDFVENEATNQGGGMYNETCSPEVTDCLFQDNAATGASYAYGGGMYNDYASPQISSCDFVGNSCDNHGGGMYNDHSDPPITNSDFVGNTATGWGSGDGEGAGMYNYISSPTLADCTFSANSAHRYGGGMKNYASSPGITNCLFELNETFATSEESDGGAMYNEHTSSVPIVVDSDFISNVAVRYGGGLASVGAYGEFHGCLFEGNSADASGGGVYLESASPTIDSSQFVGNSAGQGGGIHANYGSHLISNSLFQGNFASYYGGAIRNTSFNLNVENCVFDGNSAQDNGGAIYNHSTDPEITNCDFFGNTADFGGAVYNYSPSEPVIINSIFWSNGAGAIHDDGSSSTTITYSDVQGGFIGAGNIDATPEFVNVPIETTVTTDPSTNDNVIISNSDSMYLIGYIIEVGDDGVSRSVTSVVGDSVTFTPALASATVPGMRVDNWGPSATDLDVNFYLQSTSPCIDAADGTSAPEFDLDGNPRVDDTSTANTGIGPPWADMGTYEYQP